jgi:hypothetical protein
MIETHHTVNSEIPVKQRVREFWDISSANGIDRGSFFRVLQMDREPETSGNLRVCQKDREKLGAKKNAERDTLGVFCKLG